MRSRRSAATFGVALAVLLLAPPAAQAEWLPIGEAAYVTELVIRHRYRTNPFAYEGGISGCHRRRANKVRCEAYLFSYSRSGGSKFECDWATIVLRKHAELLYWLGPTRCHSIG